MPSATAVALNGTFGVALARHEKDDHVVLPQQKGRVPNGKLSSPPVPSMPRSSKPACTCHVSGNSPPRTNISKVRWAMGKDVIRTASSERIGGGRRRRGRSSAPVATEPFRGRSALACGVHHTLTAAIQVAGFLIEGTSSGAQLSGDAHARGRYRCVCWWARLGRGLDAVLRQHPCAAGGDASGFGNVATRAAQGRLVVSGARLARLAGKGWAGTEHAAAELLQRRHAAVEAVALAGTLALASRQARGVEDGHTGTPSAPRRQRQVARGGAHPLLLPSTRNASGRSNHHQQQ